MKKYLFLVLGLAFLLVFTSCEKDPPTVMEQVGGLSDSQWKVDNQGTDQVWHFDAGQTLKVHPRVEDLHNVYVEVYDYEWVCTDALRLQLTGLEINGDYIPDKTPCCWYDLELSPPDETGAMTATLQAVREAIPTTLVFYKDG